MPAVARRRPGQSVRRAGVLRSPPRTPGVQPIIGCALPVTGIGGRLRRALGQDARPSCCWPRTRPGWLNLCALSSAAYLDADAIDEPRVPWAHGGAARRGADPAVGRARTGRSIRLFAAGKAAEGARGAGRDEARSSATASMSSCSATAWPAEAAAEPRAGAPAPMTATRRWSPPTTSISPRRGMHEAHDALLCIADGAFIGQDDRRRVTGRALVQARRRHAGAVRRPARGLRQHPRYRPPLRLHGAEARARSCRASTPARAAPRPRNWPTRRARA